MRRILDMATLHGVIVNILQLLPHHLFVLDLFWLAPFLPNLILTLGLMRKFACAQLLQENSSRIPFQQSDDLPGRIRFGTLDDLWKLGSRRNHMQVIIQNDVAEQLEFPLSLQKTPRIENNVDSFGTREHWKPSDNSASHEIRVFRFEDAVTGPSHDACIPLSVPKLELGNEGGVDQALFSALSFRSSAFSFRFTPR